VFVSWRKEAKLRFDSSPSTNICRANVYKYWHVRTRHRDNVEWALTVTRTDWALRRHGICNGDMHWNNCQLRLST
jgi:hypothetical protein